MSPRSATRALVVGSVMVGLTCCDLMTSRWLFTGSSPIEPLKNFAEVRKRNCCQRALAKLQVNQLVL